MDWGHILEVAVGNVFVAGVAYGAIKTEIKALHDRIERCEEDIRLITFRPKGN